MKQPSPLLGFNNNVRHKGRLFHIQTEDSGVKHPHIITHLFADGGRILKTTKTSYAEHIGTEKISDTVRHLMQEQHKAMFIALRDGQFDHLLDELPPAPPAANNASTRAPMPSRPAEATERSGGASRPPIPPAPIVPRPDAPPRPTPPPQHEAAVAKAPAANVAAPIAAEPPRSPAAPLAPLAPAKRSNSRPKLDIDPSTLLVPEKRVISPTAITMMATATTETPPPSAEARDLDLSVLERAAAEAQTPYLQQIQDLPPPPAAVLGKRASDMPPGDTSYRTVGPTTHIVEPPPPPPVAGSTKSPISTPTAGRYAASRPAAIFNPRPPEGASIFGEDLISEKSLDEVILSYLAEDLDAPSEKK